jgi:glycosyltransferase involved in cell wall biosynthesis
MEKGSSKTMQVDITVENLPGRTNYELAVQAEVPRTGFSLDQTGFPASEPSGILSQRNQHSLSKLEDDLRLARVANTALLLANNDLLGSLIAAQRYGNFYQQLAHRLSQGTDAEDRFLKSRQDLSLQQARLLSARRQLQETQKLAMSILSSTSWKVTRPLRSLVSALRGQKAQDPDLQSSIDQLRAQIEDEPRPETLETQTGQAKLPGYLDAHLPPSWYWPDVTINAPTATFDPLPRPLNILGIGDGPIPSIILGLNMPLQSVAQACGGRYEVRYEVDFDRNPISDEELNQADIIFMQRVCTEQGTDLVRRINTLKIPLVYLLDDDFSLLPPDSPLGKRYLEMGAWENILSNCGKADLVMSWSPILLEKLRAHAKDTRQLHALANVEIFDSFPAPPPRKGTGLRFGFGGGLAHEADLLMILPAILTFLDRNPDSVFETVGAKLSILEGHPQYRHFPGSIDIRAYYKSVWDRDWDFVVAPLEDKPVNNAKTDNKFRESAAAGLPGIFVKAAPYLAAVEDGVTGLLVGYEPSEWLGAMERLAADKNLRASIAKNAKEVAYKTYSRQAIDREYKQVILDLVPDTMVLGVTATSLSSSAHLHWPLQCLGDARAIRYRHVLERDLKNSDLDWANTLVVFGKNGKATERLILAAKARGIKIIYVPLSQNDLFNRSQIIAASKDVDLVVLPTVTSQMEALANSVALEEIPFLPALKMSGGAKPNRSPLKIGVIGGTYDYPEFVENVLQAIAEEHRAIGIEVDAPNPSMLDRIRDLKTLKYDSKSLTFEQAVVDAGWSITICLDKGDRAVLLDPRQHWLCSLSQSVGIHFDQSVSAQSVIQGDTGFICAPNSKALEKTLVALIEDKTLVDRIAELAFERVGGHHAMQLTIQAWEVAIARLKGTK